MRQRRAKGDLLPIAPCKEAFWMKSTLGAWMGEWSVCASAVPEIHIIRNYRRYTYKPDRGPRLRNRSATIVGFEAFKLSVLQTYYIYHIR